MILSLLKILLFFAVVLALALGAQHLAQTGQPLQLVFNGTEYTLGPVQAVAAGLALLVLAWLVMKLLGFLLAMLRFVLGDQTAINRWFDRSRERKGYAALSEGMLAVASGEGRLAQDQAARAAKFLDRPEITDLLAAQAAEVAGDVDAAGAAYRRMLGDQRTRFVGVRGLMRQRLALGDTATALRLAEKAYALKPRHQEMQDQLLSLQAKAGDWKGARGVLKDKRRQGQIPADLHIRRDAVLALQEAREVLAQGNSISAREAAISANRASPDLIPAAVLAARSYIGQKDYRNAARVLEKTWSYRPHPSLAAVYAEIMPDETAAQRLKRFEGLMKQRPDDPETRLLRAELALAAEDFPGARRALGNLAESDPTVRSLSLMAAVERGEGADDSVVRGWLAKALTADRGPQWICDNCQNIMADWAPVCDSCGAFDTLSWRKAPHSLTAASPNGVELLPLLVGTPNPSPQPAEPGAAPMPAAALATQVVTERVSQTATRREPDVAPGMVPREIDYARVEPSRTVTEPEPPQTIVEVIPVRPDVEPPEPAERP
ncbi:heme biosynthesis protein HemY [Paracoccus suum]|uniref:Heme biosynthesis protein HemY n=1 Tax=Paracoccus suum TaxID=2259340 RepID=A0A344PIF1_9RHOB|nr:heme biosynthesis HemY N-terminal domain-containing protein [Paracoccus suum]AXC49156.1 heme biosynthesis protein HemY [Paracoccus suum]